MNEPPLLRSLEPEINNFIQNLEVDFAGLSHCQITEGYALELNGAGLPGLYYNLKGRAQMIIKGQSIINIEPHTLIIVPPNMAVQIFAGENDPVGIKMINGDTKKIISGELRNFVVGEGEAGTSLVLGFFNTSYGISLNPFAGLHTVIVEQFGTEIQLDLKLERAAMELRAMKVGAKAMSSVLLKEILIHVIRRSLDSGNIWVEHFAIFTNTQIARAFSTMATEPGAMHSISSLADIACLSRSAFMAQFRELFKESPMAVLRRIRMRQAAQLLALKSVSVEEIARYSGYRSKSKFNRAFQKIYEMDPSSYREKMRYGKNIT